MLHERSESHKEFVHSALDLKCAEEKLKNERVGDPEQKCISLRFPRCSSVSFLFWARYYSLTSTSHGSAPLSDAHTQCCGRASWLRADFEANSIACSPRLWCIMRLEHRHLVLVIKVSYQMEVIGRQILPVPAVMENVIAVSVIIVSLIANDAGVHFGRPLGASQIIGCESTDCNLWILIKCPWESCLSTFFASWVVKVLVERKPYNFRSEEYIYFLALGEATGCQWLLPVFC